MKIREEISFPDEVEVGDVVVCSRFSSFFNKSMTKFIGKEGVVKEERFFRTASREPWYNVHGWDWPAHAVTIIKKHYEAF